MKRFNILNPNEVFLKALKNDDVNLLRTLLKTNKTIDVRKIFFDSVKNNDIKTVKLLLDAGINPNVQDNNLSNGLMHALERGYSECAQLLLRAGTNPNTTNKWNMTALMYAVENNIEIVKFLLHAGANPNIQDSDGWTALMNGSWQGDTKCVRLLLQSGANPNLQDNKGWTALIWASYFGHTDCVRLLLEAGANPNKYTLTKGTALMEASGKGHVECVRLLLQWGANTELISIKGYTALDYAIIHKKYSCLELLLKAGVKLRNLNLIDCDLELFKVLIKSGYINNKLLNELDGMDKTIVMRIAEKGYLDKLILLLNNFKINLNYVSPSFFTLYNVANDEIKKYLYKKYKNHIIIEDPEELRNIHFKGLLSNKLKDKGFDLYLNEYDVDY